jgi:DNA-binding MarR family transcriptional regulator
MGREMTKVTPQSAPPRAEVAAVADQFIAMMRTLKKARARMVAAAAHDVDWSSQLVLRYIASEGQMRASDLAEHLESDPSTVSRQVAALVKDGLLERRADPADGRASLLALTPEARTVLAEHDRIRLEHFALALDGWSDSDLHRFAGLLRRFTEAYEATTGNWINDRIATRSGRAGSND